MLILAFESSAKAASVALTRDGQLIAQSFQNNGLTHSRTLLPMAESMMKNCGLAFSDVDLFAVAQGPGSFTGIRIGVSTVKGLSWALDKPCAGVSTLEAMAWNGQERGGIICPVMDARRSQVYNALFRSDGETLIRLTEDRAISIEELRADLSNLHEKKILVGDGAELCYNTLKDVELRLAPEHLRHQRASGVAICAVHMAQSGENGDGSALTPNYLRLSQAERERNERLKNQNKGDIS